MEKREQNSISASLYCVRISQNDDDFLYLITISINKSHFFNDDKHQNFSFSEYQNKPDVNE
ncbi:CLUMA_CG005644, isoform A [Clunio marinus]|uniref:CLUMA_CG005644, isoform A n=1 Tax=Clunio marinus TaxID=568069 RepID=A0A1J1HVH0_9DIPT|nr:CLUMA_CG005644, isoform A [Clunio marinus]